MTRESEDMREDSFVSVLFEGVYRIPDPRNPSKKILATKNLVPGRTVYGEALVRRDFETKVMEFRSWDPFRSKLSAAILNNLQNFPFKKGTNCLYLGASTGTTVSHLSDIVENEGKIFSVEMAARVAREFLENVVRYRKNVIPIIENAKHPERYPAVYGKVSAVYCDVAQPDQTEIAIRNCEEYLEEGMLFLVVKASSIDALRPKKQVFEEQAATIKNSGLKLLELIDLEPYDRNHALIVATR